MRDRTLDIAVTGLTFRLPGPEAPREWWAAVCAGDVLTSRLDPFELASMGVPPETYEHPSYVPVRGCIKDIDQFDAELFGISPREAELIDPQHRLMLEATWTALEDAGCNPLDDRLRTGVFASASQSRYGARVLSRPDLDPDVAEQMTVGAGRDFMAGRIAYRLGLKGPALGVLTACSSSLVAVHLAMQALINGDCDQAVVVAASLGWPAAGYRYARGGIMSIDGLCRPFDADATGTVGGSGVVAVILRRHADVATGVPVHGLLLGSAVNNDGAAKAGFNAPSPQGQADAIRAALAAGDVLAASIGYLETHGTGTLVGDPIEWSAASKVLREAGVPHGQVAVGAVKANIGHLDAAAGLAGLLKALFVVRDGQIPPVANFRRLNPLLDSIETPLRVPRTLEQWSACEPRRAAVSSFGIGGTNAHVIIEQAPPESASVAPSDDGHVRIVVLSAVRPTSLESAARELAEHLDRARPELGQVAHTLTVGRAPLAERLAVTCRTTVEAVKVLSEGGTRGRVPAAGPRPLVFLLPGQGSQRPGMAVEFLEQLPGFEVELADCLRSFEPALARRVEAALTDPGFSGEELRATSLTQPTLFTLEYAAVRALERLGLRPVCLAGHSLGEVTAACLSGLVNLEDAAQLVTLRAQAMQACPSGAMLAVTCSEAEAIALTSGADGCVEIAAVNGPAGCVLSGSVDAVEALERQVAGRFPVRRLHTTHGFHSRLMEPAVSRMRQHLSGRRGGRVTVPFVAGMEGRLIEPGHEPPLDMFAANIRAGVRFGDGLRALVRRFPTALAVEVGPGRGLSAMAAAVGLDAVPLAARGQADKYGPAQALAELWVQGQPVDLAAYAPAARLMHLPVSFLGGSRFVAAEAAFAPITASAAPSSPPSSPTATPAEEVRAAWLDLLGHADLAADDDFTDRGGDSLTLIRLARRLEEALLVTIALPDLIRARTLGDQIALVERLCTVWAEAVDA